MFFLRQHIDLSPQVLLSLLNLLLTLRRVFREQLQLPNLSGDLLWREIVHIAESQA